MPKNSSTQQRPTPKPPRARPAGGESRGDKRRHRIFLSLHDCILEKGYVKTSLADVAAGADMSASHLLYYFKGKETILEQYFEHVSLQFLERLEDFSQLDPREQIRSLADLWFEGEANGTKEIGFMLECFGAAVNDDVLKVTKSDFDLRCKAYLLGIFEAAPQRFIASARDSAEVCYSLMIGLRTAVYFDKEMDLPEAHRLFLSSTLSMCGLK